MSQTELVDSYLQAHLDESLRELSRLCAQPSVAAQNLGMQACAELVQDLLVQRGFTTEIAETDGHPVILAERGGQTDKTLLFYNHYDVQPPEPLELWDSPPFEPERREGKLFARGVSDDKGHITSRLLAIDAFLDRHDELPCRIKFIIEGEEEIGSVHLPAFVSNHKEELQADACVWEFGGVDHRDVPLQYLGLRGICYLELSVKTADADVHSGLGGSIFPNAAWRLVWALASLKNEHEVIQIPDFYQPVVPPSARDLELLEQLPDVSQEYRDRYGIPHFLKGIEGGLELHQTQVFEPTCTICGLTSGYQGPGSKTVLPAQASAKVDFRLVPNQTPEDVIDGVRSHLDQAGFSDVSLTYLGGGPPARTDPDHPFVQLTAEAARDVYGVPMTLVPLTGGSGPNHAFVHTLGLPVVTAGIGYPGSNAHAPNENIRLDLYLKGAQHIARIIQAFSRQD